MNKEKKKNNELVFFVLGILFILFTGASSGLWQSVGNYITPIYNDTIKIYNNGTVTYNDYEICNIENCNSSSSGNYLSKTGDNATGYYIWNGSHIFNEYGLNNDFRIEGENFADLFFIDASSDTVKIGESGTNPSSSNSKLVYHTNGYTSFEMRSASDLSYYRNGMNWRRSRGTLGSRTQVQNNDWIGDFNAVGTDPAGGDEGVAALMFLVDGTPNNDYIPGRIEFRTTKDSTQETGISASIRMVIKSSGNVGIGTLTPSYPLVIGNNVSGISLWTQGNISADGYLERSTVFEGDALSNINNASYYLDEKGNIVHENHVCFSGYKSETDYSRPVYSTDYFRYCEDEECPYYENVTITYPYTKEVPTWSVSCKAALTEQALSQYKNVALPVEIDGIGALDTKITIADEYYTKSKTVDNTKNYLDNFKDSKTLSDKNTHYALKIYNEKEYLSVEDRIVALEGFANQLIIELCKNNNRYDFCNS